MKQEAKTGESYPIERQEGEKREKIKGFKIIEIERNYPVEDGRFVEIGRLTEEGTLLDLPELKVRQINYAEVVPGTRKAWHVHLEQDEAWFIHPNSRLIAGFMDIRGDSHTQGNIHRRTLGGGKAQLVFIPKGVAHGLSNPYLETASMNYLVDRHYDGSDEYRLPFDFEVGEDFWEIGSG